MSLKRRLSEPGIVVSALVHVGVLAATLIAFSSNEKFDDIQETVPVEVVTDNQFNQIMKGEKSAKDVHPEAIAKAEQIAPETTEQPTPPTPEKSQPTPPPPPPPLPPVRDVQQKPPAPIPPPAPLPPPRPAPPQPQQEAPAVPTPPVRDVAEEPDLPKPVPKPPKPVVKPTPMPPVVPHPTIAKAAEPKPVPPKVRPVDKPKPDQVAKLMQDLPSDPTPPAPAPMPNKSRQSPTPSETSKFDLTDITKLLSSSAPAQRPSTSRDTSRLASLGSPTASAPKMSPSFWAGLDGVMEDQYRQCWSYLGLNTGVKYVPQIRVVYSSSGSLEGEPVLVNPPSDPSLRSLADSAMRAVRRCNPLKIPDQYAPYYDQWKGRVLRFDPEEMAG